MQKSTKEQIEEEVINLVLKEKNKWENAEVQVTEKVWFDMRDLIRTARKNYYGVFDHPKDPITGRKRVFYPLTEELCDAIAPKIGVKVKNIDFTATNGDGYITAEIARLGVRKFIRDNYVGEMQDDDTYNLVIDGTAVRKTWTHKGQVKSRNVDLLNIFIDPTAESIQSAYRFLERGVMYADDIARMNWMNNKDLLTGENVPRVDTQEKLSSSEGTPQRDVWEMYGKIPKYLLTGKMEDTEDVDGHVIISGLEAGGAKVHVLEYNTNKDKDGEVVKPYEEVRYIRVPGRWYGKGVAEKVMILQIWMNLIVNIRITRATLSQLGVFKIRRGSNITSSQIGKLGVNGTISVNSMDDIEQMIIQEASSASYNDENNIRDIAQRLTSAFEVVTGENLAASTPATNAAIASRGAQGTFNAIIDRYAMFVQRWINRQILPRLAKTWDTKTVMNLFGDDERFEALIERVAVFHAKEELYKADQIPTEEALMASVEDLKDSYRKKGNAFITDLKELVISAVDTRVQVSDHDMDNAVIADKLISTLQLAPEFKGHIIKELYNVLNLPIPTELLRDLSNPAMNKTLMEQGRADQELQQAQMEQQALAPVQAETDQTITQLSGSLANRT